MAFRAALLAADVFQRTVRPSELSPKAKSMGQKRVMPSATFMALSQRTERVQKLVRYGQRAMRLMAHDTPTRPTVMRIRASQVPTFFFIAVHLHNLKLALNERYGLDGVDWI